MNPEKTYLQSLYKCTHPIFYGTRFARGKRVKAPTCPHQVPRPPVEAPVKPVLVFCYRARRQP